MRVGARWAVRGASCKGLCGAGRGAAVRGEGRGVVGLCEVLRARGGVGRRTP